MAEALGEERWAAIRDICEGAFPTHERMAAACGLYVKTISRRVASEGWQTLDFRRPRVRQAYAAMVDIARRAGAGEEFDPVDDDDAPDDADEDGVVAPGVMEAERELAAIADLPAAGQIARLRALLTRRSAELLARAEGGRPFESRQVAALTGMVSLTERIAALAVEEQRRENVGETEEIRDVLARLDARIEYLARGYARIIAVETFGLDAEEVDARLGKLEEG